MRDKKLTQAITCARYLAEHGFDVLAIDLEFPKPRIKIVHSSKCSRLAGNQYGRRVTADAVIYRMGALVMGCLVEWDERAAA